MITYYQIREFLLNTAAKDAVSDLTNLSNCELMDVIRAFLTDYVFDANYYVKNNPHYAPPLDPLEHFIRHGLAKGASFRITRREKSDSDRIWGEEEPKSVAAISAANTLQGRNRVPMRWSVLICSKNADKKLLLQIEAIRNQTAAPTSISVVCRQLPSAAMREAIGEDIEFIRSPSCPLAFAFAISALQPGQYIAIVEEGTIPGKGWLTNSLRACADYNALAVARGKLFRETALQVMAASKKMHLEDADNKACDVYCDTGYGAWVFRREWAPFLLPENGSYPGLPEEYRYAFSLATHLNIPCIAPICPPWAPEFGVIIGDASGTEWDEPAVNVGTTSGYTPVIMRDNLTRFHIITSFGSRAMLERCINSVLAQVYLNYTFTLIDDCMDDEDIHGILKTLEAAGIEFRYIRNRIKMGAMGGQTFATDSLDANPADVIVHLDGDDWFAHPHVLWQLNKIYLAQNASATYGNMLSLNSRSTDFSGFVVPLMSRTWNMISHGAPAERQLVRRLVESDLRAGWRGTHWWALHTRTFRFANWLLHNRDAFRLPDGSWLERISDAAIMVPMLDAMPRDSIIFNPDVSYIYQNLNNTNHFLNPVTDIEDEAIKTHIAKSCEKRNESNLARWRGIYDKKDAKNAKHEMGNVAEVIERKSHKEIICNLSADISQKSAVCAIISPDYIAEGLLALTAYTRNIDSHCDKHLFITDSNPETKKLLKFSLAESGISVHFPGEMKYCVLQEDSLARKYRIASNYYRWGMKSVFLQELLMSGYGMCLYIDSDIYTVSNVQDLHSKLCEYAISVFPHFRDPDKEESRKYLYRDGFFNGGMLAATPSGIPALQKLTERCILEMEINPDRNRYDDQKYYDYFLTEVDNLYINQDRGIDFNAWNEEPWEGFVAPTQRSFLLKSGVFVRIWHIAYGDMSWIKHTKQRIFRSHLLAICIHHCTNIFIMLLWLIKIRLYPATSKMEAYFIRDHWEKSYNILGILCPGFDRRGVKSLYEALSSAKERASCVSLSQWYDCLQSSFCYDNFEVFAQLIDMLFHDNGSAISRILRRNDLRFISEDVEGALKIKYDADYDKLEEQDSGKILNQYLRNLATAQIPGY